MISPCCSIPVPHGTTSTRRSWAARRRAPGEERLLRGRVQRETDPQGKKSVTIRLSIGSDEKTLTSQEIESAANQVMKKLGKKMGAELRTQ